MNLLVFDFECFKYNWCVTIKNLETQEYIIIRDNVELLDMFIKSNLDAIWIGYNNQGYDSFILDSILTGWNPFVVSQRIIQQHQKGWLFYKKFKYHLNHYDLLQHLTQKPSLKMCEGNMGLEIKESIISFDLDRELNDDEWDEVLKYNKHDVDATEILFWQTQQTFMSHLLLIQMFHLPLTALGKTFANLAAMILGATKQQLWKNEINGIIDKDYYEAPNNLKLGKYQFIKDYFGNNVGDDFQSRKVIIAGTDHIIGLGGIHGDSHQHYYETNDDYVLIMLDVTSYYPNLMILYNYLSRSIKDPNKYKEILNWRIKAKNNQEIQIADALKLVINIVYGASGAQFNPLFDPRMRKSVCITGQLFLIDLIEKIEPYLEKNNLIQSNTDGILIKINYRYLDKLNEIIKEWETRTGFNLESTICKKIHQKDVNNYILLQDNGKIKVKGSYVKEKTLDMNSEIIVNETITEYFVNNIDPKIYLHQEHSLDKFQYIAKAGVMYQDLYHQQDNQFNQLDQRVNRCFATTLLNQGTLFKRKADKVTYEKIANLPDHCLILNENIQGNTNLDLNEIIDYQYYLDKIYKRINEFLG